MDGQCSKCKMQTRLCRTAGETAGPPFCSTLLYEDSLKQADQAYTDPALKEFALAAARQEAACYVDGPFDLGEKAAVKTRIEETLEFCQRMGYRRIGLAFCSGLHKEAEMLAAFFESRGLEVVSAVCKVGRRPKETLGLADGEKIRPGTFEPMCNPVGQAMILNEAGCAFNVVVGLCVGHDSLFLKHSQALCTVLAAKDRLLGHNPLAALYTSHSYYKYLQGNK